MYLMVNRTLSLQGEVYPPSSKSQSIRGMLFALLAKGDSTLFNVLDSDDTQTARQVCIALGAKVSVTQRTLTIQSNGLPLINSTTEINTGNSGITTRFILPILGLRENYTSPLLLTCGQQMRSRPIQSLCTALTNLGMDIQYVEQEDRLPVVVTGKLTGGHAEIEGITSQYLSALLIALPCAESDSTITVKDLHERPYINMTLDWLKQQGIAYRHKHINNTDTFYIPGKQRYTTIHTIIKGDFSSASCLIAAAVLLPGAVTLQGLDNDDPQGDKKLIAILQKMGAEIITEGEKIKINGNKPLNGIRIDANDIPDLLPALAVIATQASGKTKIYNVKQARIKETDRIRSMTEGLRQMGARIEEHYDGMTVYQSELQGTFVKGYDDHRTVMALTVAGMVANGSTLITDGNAINKTYPEFVETMQSIGANVTRHDSIANKHIILIGFKHVGKSLIGQQLAKLLDKEFIDLDAEIVKMYLQEHGQSLSCRQIMQLHGESQYRKLESEALNKILNLTPRVISLGGGSVICPINQTKIKPHILLHVIAPRGIVFERIMVEGRPAFFNLNEDPYESFIRLWNDRDKIFKKMTVFTVDNHDTVERAVNEAMMHIQGNQNYA